MQTGARKMKSRNEIYATEFAHTEIVHRNQHTTVATRKLQYDACKPKLANGGRKTEVTKRFHKTQFTNMSFDNANTAKRKWWN